MSEENSDTCEWHVGCTRSMAYGERAYVNIGCQEEQMHFGSYIIPLIDSFSYCPFCGKKISTWLPTTG